MRDSIVVLAGLVGAGLLTVWSWHRFPGQQSWFENRLAWLCPRDLVIGMETLAQAHPYRYTLLMFFESLGALTLFNELMPASSLSSLVRYGASGCRAVFQLYTSRMTARHRAAQSGAA